eukprot:13513245-Alexandrium_andersonii.AAC.1
MVLWESGQSANRLRLRGQTLDPNDQIRSNRKTGSSSEQRGNTRTLWRVHVYSEQSELLSPFPRLESLGQM